MHIDWAVSIATKIPLDGILLYKEVQKWIQERGIEMGRSLVKITNNLEFNNNYYSIPAMAMRWDLSLYFRNGFFDSNRNSILPKIISQRINR